MPKKTYQCSIETRNLILRKVHDEAAQNNEMPSIKEICALCGLSRGTFYLYFPSMDAALSTLAQECFRSPAYPFFSTFFSSFQSSMH